MGQYDLNCIFKPRQVAELNTPMVCGVTQEEVGRTALFLLSNLFSSTVDATAGTTRLLSLVNRPRCNSGNHPGIGILFDGQPVEPAFARLQAMNGRLASQRSGTLVSHWPAPAARRPSRSRMETRLPYWRPNMRLIIIAACATGQDAGARPYRNEKDLRRIPE